MAVPSIMTKKNVVPSEQYYEEILQKAANYNKKICYERKMRLPFIDSQTGVAQRHTNLFIPYRYRMPGKEKGQLYSFPSKRWKRKKSCLPFSDLNMAKSRDAEGAESDAHSNLFDGLSAKEALDRGEIPEKTINVAKAAQDYRFYYDDWENLSEPPDAGEIDQRDSDSSDFEETYTKKKRRRGKGKGSRGGGRGKRAERKDVYVAPKPAYDESKTSYDEDNEKPYSCDICGIRYKTKPGLTYHMTHHHVKGSETVDEQPSLTPIVEPVAPIPISIPPTPREPEISGAPSSTLGGIVSEQDMPGKYCDFCLGDAIENKKTGLKEELVSCADCGRSGHPSCLQFTPNMIISVKKYPWQCIECKSCGLCGTSENDDQLLFCDDCDRGFHMYCLKPPLSQPPDGNWSCHLCIVEFYGGKKPEGME